MDRKVVVVPGLGKFQPQVDQMVLRRAPGQPSSRHALAASMISSVSFLPLAFDQTWRVNRCSLPLLGSRAPVVDAGAAEGEIWKGQVRRRVVVDLRAPEQRRSERGRRRAPRKSLFATQRPVRSSLSPIPRAAVPRWSLRACGSPHFGHGSLVRLLPPDRAPASATRAQDRRASVSSPASSAAPPLPGRRDSGRSRRDRGR